MKCYIAGIRPNYVEIIKNKNERAMLSELRISAHELATECCKYMNIYELALLVILEICIGLNHLQCLYWINHLAFVKFCTMNLKCWILSVL